MITFEHVACHILVLMRSKETCHLQKIVFGTLKYYIYIHRFMNIFYSNYT